MSLRLGRCIELVPGLLDFRLITDGPGAERRDRLQKVAPERDYRHPDDYREPVIDFALKASEEAIGNLRAEGIGQERMHFVGNTMIDTLVALEDRIAARAYAISLTSESGTDEENWLRAERELTAEEG